jgi:hypothetical protein
LVFVLVHVGEQTPNVQHTIFEAFYNKHLSRGKVVVENAFWILKKIQKIVAKKNLHSFFSLTLLHVITCYITSL